MAPPVFVQTNRLSPNSISGEEFMLRSKFGFVARLPAAALLVGCLVSAAAAQETSEESRSDQEKVGEAGVLVAEGKVVVSEGDGKVRVFRLKKGNGDGFVWVRGDEEQEGAAAGSGEAKKKRIAFFVGPEGTKQEVILESDLDIDMGGHANGVWLDEPGDVKGEGWSILRIVTGDEENAGIRFRQEPEIIAQIAAQVGGYMIGVSCEPVSGALASQLGLEKGLVVLSVTGDAPASGKLEAHDIITHTDGNAIGEIDELIKAVQAAGEADGEMKLTLLRGGKSLEVGVKPVKREMREATLAPGQGQWFTGDLDLKLISPQINSAEGVLLESFGPGVFRRLETSGAESGVAPSADALKAEIEALRKQIEELAGRLEKDD
jgi:PDZ domain